MNKGGRPGTQMRPKPCAVDGGSSRPGVALNQMPNRRVSQLRVETTSRPNRTQSQQRNMVRQTARPTTQAGTNAQLTDSMSFRAASILPSINDENSSRATLTSRRRASQPPALSVYKQYLKTQNDLSFTKQELKQME